MGHGEFLWCDLAAYDAERALDFYGRLLDWTYRSESFPDGPDYHYADYGGDVAAGIYEMPQTFRDQGILPFWMSYIGVEDIDAALAATEAAGGRTRMGPATFGHGAAIAMVEDPLGTVFTLFDGQHLQPRSRVPAAGRAFWAELMTPDLETSSGFYKSVFNWKIGSPDHNGIAAVRNMADAITASVRVVPEDAAETPAMLRWHIGFGVEDLRAAKKFVEQSGGSIAPLTGADNRMVARDPEGSEFYIALAKTRRGWFG